MVFNQSAVGSIIIIVTGVLLTMILLNRMCKLYLLLTIIICEISMHIDIQHNVMHSSTRIWAVCIVFSVIVNNIIIIE